MNRIILIALLLVSACGPRDVRIAPGDIPEAAYLSAQDEAYGHEVLNQLTQQYPIRYDSEQLTRVRDLVDRLTEASGAGNDPWHVYILEGPDFKNAAATRGNHVFVWTGILNVVRDDDELATILAHEIGHVLARHTMQDPSEEAASILSGTAGTIVKEILSQQGGAYGLAAGLAGALVESTINAVALNPDLQRKELEADQVGLFLMADAGFNPDNAVAFWERIKDDPAFSSALPAFLSTHPSSEQRIERLQTLLPLAEDRYQYSMKFLKPEPKKQPRNKR